MADIRLITILPVPTIPGVQQPVGTPNVGGHLTAGAVPPPGTILSGFGGKGTGLNNDGVNIGAPKGSPVTAAAPGTVVYAGNEMKRLR